MLSKLGRVLRVDIGAACLHHREKHDSPKHPRQFEDFTELELAVVLDKKLARGRIRWCPKALVGQLGKEEEDKRAHICEDGDACSDPKDPGKVPEVLKRG